MEALASIPKELLQPHPVLPLPTRQAVQAWLQQGDAGRLHLENLLRERAEKINLERLDPLRHSFEPETYAKVRELLGTYDEVLLNGANREGKTHCAGKLSVEHLVDAPNRSERTAAFLHSSDRTSIDQQQPVIFQFLPPNLRDLALRGVQLKAGTYLKYSRAGGFANDKFILPNGAMGLFFNYKQDVGVMEGYKLSWVWFDELVPLAFLDALTYRLGQGERLIIVITFTPVRGYTPVVARYIAGAKILETRPATLLPPNQVHVKGCPPGHMPYVMQSRRPRSAVMFFHWGQNPFGASREVQKKLEGAKGPVIKIRAYGYAEKLTANAFPKFSEKVHVISSKRFWDDIYPKGGTWYLGSDPRPSRNWFFKWYFVTPMGWTIVVREWPDFARYGEWAIPPADSNDAEESRKNDWRPGPAQRIEAGRGFAAYKSLLLEQEGWSYDIAKKVWVKSDKTWSIERRVMDPRFGGSEVPSQEEGQTPIEMMDTAGDCDPLGRVMPAMAWEQAPASAVHGAGSALDMIVTAMDYNEQAEISVLNCPRWYVVDECQHSILAYQEFSSSGTEKNALKDPVDCDRYFIKADCGYVGATTMKMKRPNGRVF
jgi:phage terminase large subunit-like protein